jgi:hypothetical protein
MSMAMTTKPRRASSMANGLCISRVLMKPWETSTAGAGRRGVAVAGT